MTTKNTPSGRALEHLDSGDISWQMWLYDNANIIRTALLRSHAIESGEAKLEPQGSDRPQGEIEAWNKAIDNLKGIGHDE